VNDDEKMPWELEQDARQSLTTWKTWSDDGNQDQWPYPDKHTKSKADGELATRIRYALGQESSDEPVYLVEHTEHRGTYYTQENFRWLEVECDGRSMKFTSTFSQSAFAQLLEWLDSLAPKPHCDTCTCSYAATSEPADNAKDGYGQPLGW
jgi:hypothetical protein